MMRFFGLMISVVSSDVEFTRPECVTPMSASLGSSTCCYRDRLLGSCFSHNVSLMLQCCNLVWNPELNAEVDTLENFFIPIQSGDPPDIEISSLSSKRMSELGVPMGRCELAWRLGVLEARIAAFSVGYPFPIGPPYQENYLQEAQDISVRLDPQASVQAEIEAKNRNFSDSGLVLDQEWGYYKEVFTALARSENSFFEYFIKIDKEGTQDYIEFSKYYLDAKYPEKNEEIVKTRNHTQEAKSRNSSKNIDFIREITQAFVLQNLHYFSKKPEISERFLFFELPFWIQLSMDALSLDLAIVKIPNPYAEKFSKFSEKSEKNPENDADLEVFKMLKNSAYSNILEHTFYRNFGILIPKICNKVEIENLILPAHLKSASDSLRYPVELPLSKETRIIMVNKENVKLLGNAPEKVIKNVVFLKKIDFFRFFLAIIFEVFRGFQEHLYSLNSIISEKLNDFRGGIYCELHFEKKIPKNSLFLTEYCSYFLNLILDFLRTFSENFYLNFKIFLEKSSENDGEATSLEYSGKLFFNFEKVFTAENSTFLFLIFSYLFFAFSLFSKNTVIQLFSLLPEFSKFPENSEEYFEFSKTFKINLLKCLSNFSLFLFALNTNLCSTPTKNNFFSNFLKNFGCEITFLIVAFPLFQKLKIIFLEKHSFSDISEILEILKNQFLFLGSLIFSGALLIPTLQFILPFFLGTLSGPVQEFENLKKINFLENSGIFPSFLELFDALFLLQIPRIPTPYFPFFSVIFSEFFLIFFVFLWKMLPGSRCNFRPKNIENEKINPVSISLIFIIFSFFFAKKIPNFLSSTSIFRRSISLFYAFSMFLCFDQMESRKNGKTERVEKNKKIEKNEKNEKKKENVGEMSEFCLSSFLPSFLELFSVFGIFIFFQEAFKKNSSLFFFEFLSDFLGFPFFEIPKKIGFYKYENEILNFFSTPFFQLFKNYFFNFSEKFPDSLSGFPEVLGEFFLIFCVFNFIFSKKVDIFGKKGLKIEEIKKEFPISFLFLHFLSGWSRLAPVLSFLYCFILKYLILGSRKKELKINCLMNMRQPLLLSPSIFVGILFFGIVFWVLMAPVFSIFKNFFGFLFKKVNFLSFLSGLLIFLAIFLRLFLFPLSGNFYFLPSFLGILGKIENFTFLSVQFPLQFFSYLLEGKV